MVWEVVYLWIRVGTKDGVGNGSSFRVGWTKGGVGGGSSVGLGWGWSEETGGGG